MLLKCMNYSLSTRTGIFIFGDVQKPSWHGAEQPALGETAWAVGLDKGTSRSPSQPQTFCKSVKKTCSIVNMIKSVTVVNKFFKFCPKKKKISGIICYPQFMFLSVYGVWAKETGGCVYTSKASCHVLIEIIFVAPNSCSFLEVECKLFSLFRCTQVERGSHTEGSWGLSETAAINPQST